MPGLEKSFWVMVTTVVAYMPTLMSAAKRNRNSFLIMFLFFVNTVVNYLIVTYLINC